MNTKQFKLLAILFFVFSLTANAAKFTNLSSQAGVEFSYKWKYSKFWDKSSAMVLVIKALNTNAYAVEVSYTVDYFWQGITKASGNARPACIKPKKTLILNGKKQGFDTGMFTNAEIKSEDFMMELSGISVKQVDACPK